MAALPRGEGPSPEDVYWHGRMVAKLAGFIDSPAQTLRRYPEADDSDAAALARAIAWHRRPDPGRAAGGDGRAHRGAARRRLPARPRGAVPARGRRRRRGGRGLARGGGAGAARAADPRRPRPGAAQHRRRPADARRRATRWRARPSSTARTARCCATSRSPRRGSATRAPRRSRRPSASCSRASSATPAATPRGPRRCCPRAGPAGGRPRISLGSPGARPSEDRE